MCYFMYCIVITVFLRSDAMATIFLLHLSVQLLFEGSVYLFGKPADINNRWIKYIQAIQ